MSVLREDRGRGGAWREGREWAVLPETWDAPLYALCPPPGKPPLYLSVAKLLPALLEVRCAGVVRGSEPPQTGWGPLQSLAKRQGRSLSPVDFAEKTPCAILPRSPPSLLLRHPLTQPPFLNAPSSPPGRLHPLASRSPCQEAHAHVHPKQGGWDPHTGPRDPPVQDRGAGKPHFSLGPGLLCGWTLGPRQRTEQHPAEKGSQRPPLPRVSAGAASSAHPAKGSVAGAGGSGSLQEEGSHCPWLESRATPGGLGRPGSQQKVSV